MMGKGCRAVEWWGVCVKGAVRWMLRLPRALN